MPPKRVNHVFRWDLDKTYLRTEFDSVRDLVKSAFETATDKQAVPGAPALLRALRQSSGHRICIVSGSPRQMGKVLAAKLKLDGVDYDEFVLKDNLRNLMRGRFRAMRAQIPYKLPVLLASRLECGEQTPDETLFGDDAESDAIIYSLYADLLEGRVPLEELPRILEADRAYPDQVTETMALARRLTRAPSVKRILIHLDRHTPTGQFSPFGRRVVPIYNYFQAALVLYGDGVLTARQVLFVALEMLDHEYTLDTLANSLQNLLLRGRLYRDTAARLALECSEAASEGALGERSDLPPFDQIAWAFAVRVRDLGESPPLESPSANPKLDYVALVDADHARRRKKKQHRRVRRPGSN